MAGRGVRGARVLLTWSLELSPPDSEAYLPLARWVGVRDLRLILTRENSLFPQVKETEDFWASDPHNGLDALG